MPPLHSEETSKFIRESAALLNKTANFFENFSDRSSMDFSTTDKSKKEDYDKLLRSSIQSDSSQWSLSSMEYNNLPACLQKFDRFLSIGNGVNNDKKKENEDK